MPWTVKSMLLRDNKAAFMNCSDQSIQYRGEGQCLLFLLRTCRSEATLTLKERSVTGHVYKLWQVAFSKEKKIYQKIKERPALISF